jgi:hypothetical protein
LRALFEEIGLNYATPKRDKNEEVRRQTFQNYGERQSIASASGQTPSVADEESETPAEFDRNDRGASDGRISD